MWGRYRQKAINVASYNQKCTNENKIWKYTKRWNQYEKAGLLFKSKWKSPKNVNEVVVEGGVKKWCQPFYSMA